VLGFFPARLFFYMSKGSILVSSAILGLDIETIEVGGKYYTIKPPTIAVLCGMGRCLGDLAEARDVQTILQNCFNGAEGCAKALSWLIQGDEGLYEELSHASLEEVVAGLEKGIGLISTENFLRLSALTKSVGELIARPK